MPLFALVKEIAPNPPVVIREQVDPERSAEHVLKLGWSWRQIIDSTVGTGPVRVGTVETILATTVTRVTTMRARTAQEIDDAETQIATSNADEKLGKMAYLDTNGLFRIVNEYRLFRSFPVLSRTDFLAYCRGEAVPNSPAPPAASSITRDQFIAFVKGL